MRTVAAALALVAGVSVLPASATAARPAPVAAVDAFGVNGGVLWPDGNRLLDPAAHAAAIGRTGLRSVRAIPFWNLVEPEAPDPRTGVHRYHWRHTDPIARHLARNELRWDALLGYSTTWGGIFPGSPTGAPRPGPFSQYAAAIARRYGRRGDFWKANPDVPYVPIVNYQVWNEPNLPGITNIDPRTYADIYAATRTAILAEDPNARVVVGGLSHSTTSNAANATGFLREMLRARPDLAGNVDAVGLTIYRRNPGQVMEQLAEVRRTLDELGERDTPIDINETGWATRGSVPLTDIEPIDEELRAVFLRELVGRLAAADCGIGTVSPFAWVTAEDNPSDASAWFGLASRSGAAIRRSGSAFSDAAGAALRAALPPVSAPSPCGRPDLPRLTQDRPPARTAFKVTLSRRCSARRLIVRYTLGPDPEPFQRFAITMPKARNTRIVADPDGAGPRSATTKVTVRMPRRTGLVTVAARDELGRLRTTGSARLKACRTPSRTASRVSRGR